jgi:hypothetical protein
LFVFMFLLDCYENINLLNMLDDRQLVCKHYARFWCNRYMCSFVSGAFNAVVFATWTVCLHACWCNEMDGRCAYFEHAGATGCMVVVLILTWRSSLGMFILQVSRAMVCATTRWFASIMYVIGAIVTCAVL